MPSDNHPNSRCPACQQRRNSLRERHQPRRRINNNIASERLDCPPSLSLLQSRATRRVHHRTRPIDRAAGPIHPTIDPRRWETERPSEVGRDPHGPPLPSLDDLEEEDSREESERWREEDLVHGMDIAFAAPGVPPFNVRVRGRVAPSNSSNAPGMLGVASEEMATDIL